MSIADNINGADAVVVALGSNLRGQYRSSRALLEAAIAEFPSIGMEVIAQSEFWRSAAWPDPTDPPYFNAVVMVDTHQAPNRIMERLLELEGRFGRRRDRANGARTLDLDLIAAGRVTSDAAALVLPHPRAHLRRFVMGPLAQIAPGWRHPVLDRSAAELAALATVGADARPV